MSILIDPDQRVIIQGITGREGLTRARLMRGYHTQVVAGVTPGKGGGCRSRRPRIRLSARRTEAVGEDRHQRAVCACRA
ncbi:hypothetical protein [Candidatus Flexifilum breve]|uniref:hypothetical protein n=1 Tax=Candidatus Flexifilum breve TaxID=3140694 RepID=UPI0031CCC68A